MGSRRAITRLSITFAFTLVKLIVTADRTIPRTGGRKPAHTEAEGVEPRIAAVAEEKSVPMVPAVAHKANRVFVVHEPTRDPGEPAIVVDEVHNLVDREGILEVIAGDGIRNRGRIIRSFTIAGRHEAELLLADELLAPQPAIRAIAQCARVLLTLEAS